MSEFIDESQITIRYEREYGVHQFTLSDERRVTAVSQPDWPSCSEALDSLHAPGEYIATPELITMPGSISDIHATLPEVRSRTAEAREMSAQFGGSVMLLGTVLHDTHQDMPRNSIAFLQDGREVGRTYKTPYVGERELAAFGQMRSIADSRAVDSQTLPIICSDILFHKWSSELKVGMLPDDQTYYDPLRGKDTIIMAGCWAVPLAGDSERMPKGDERYLGPLEFAVNALFRRYDRLQDIVVVDRSPAPTGTVVAPFNAHFQRKQQTIVI